LADFDEFIAKRNYIYFYGHIGNIREQSIHEIWNSPKMAEAPKMMYHCRFHCLLGCMYEPTLMDMIKKGFRVAVKIFRQ